ncbi:MAG: bifunctional demethylmenaquinone methyltransferase/2-methoxy-6-polyprenyl-1,4-benzoquinol methylase UbiE [Phycisphaerales bacterium]|nr:bifunctional demethylmenaquinone methyltransferase/2-methoxy-6-polyprenyl-1,4-benzoquinol methylase UbiE [Phycisphaerales bacterium]
MYPHDSIVPYKESSLSKKEQVASMFNNIADGYDQVNSWASVQIDRYWRKNLVAVLLNNKPHKILDAATGTGKVAYLLHNKIPHSQIIGIDMSEKMLAIANKKKELHPNQSKDALPLFEKQDCECTSFQDNTFDAITIAFGIRNFENLEKGLFELYRILSPAGTFAILEFSKPTMPFVKSLYNLHMHYITPMIGKLFTNNKQAYQYLFDSAHAFPEGDELKRVLSKIGFKNIKSKVMSLGVCSLYWGTK